ncbi:hypothetical protein [Phaeovulum sp. W22_SRMD_FR3]|uniref:hypothetical protein n=1 Tax=Phaeovulum sp. W22_SRMD_FR3 TaxID=3240274 RepID=UPI003F9C02D4
MTHFSLGISLRLMRQTWPFLLFRVLVYFGIAAGFVLATGTGAGLGYGIGGFWDDETRLGAAVWGGVGGFGLSAGLLYLAREYLLYLVKAGHIAVMVEALQGRALPEGQGQIAYARAIVTARFGQASLLFGLDQLVKGVIGAVTGLLQGLFSILPIPGLERVMALVRAYLKVAVGLMDEVMLAHVLRTRAENPYAAARTALVLYAQNARPLLISAAWITALIWLLSVVVFVLMLAPAAALVWFLPGQASAASLVFAVLFAWAVKAALIEPFAIACLLQAFFTVSEGQSPNPEWQRKLDGVSERFKTLGTRAMSWTGRGSTSSSNTGDAA